MNPFVISWLTHVIIFILLGEKQASSSSHCYRRCNCLRRTPQIYKECPLNKTDLYIFLNTEHIDVVCKKYLPNLMDGVPEFDVSYLTNLDDESPLTLKSMVKKCHKTKDKHIKYNLDAQRFKDIIITNSILEHESDLKLLNIQGNSKSNNTNHNVLNYTTNFLEYSSNLEQLILNNNNLSALGKYFLYVPKLIRLDLSSNQIDTLSEGTFEGLERLEILSLKDNKLKYLNQGFLNSLTNITHLDLSQNQIGGLANDTFDGSEHLTYLNLSNNNLRALETGTFVSTTALQYLDFQNNPNIILPDNICENLTSLKVLNISNCSLDYLSERLFQGCMSLETVNLAKNQLKELKNYTFKDLPSLKEINLNYNQLKILPKDLFCYLENLERLFLRHNKLTVFDADVFRNIPAIKTIDLSNNRIATFTNLLGRFRADEVILRSNNITEFPELLAYGILLKDLDLSYNNIKSVRLIKELIPKACQLNVDLSHNSIMHMNISSLETNNKNSSNKYVQISMDLSHNYVTCNCDRFQINTVDSKLQNAVLKIIKQESICMDKDTNRECHLVDIKNCPENCDCYFMTKDTAIVVDCSYRNFTSFPELNNLDTNYYSYKHTQTYVLLNGNSLDMAGQQHLKKYSNVTYLDLSNNRISKLQSVPVNLKWLNLENNYLNAINEEVIKSMTKNRNLKTILLNHNPWTCDCSALHLQKYLIRYNNIKVNQSAVICHTSGEPLVYTKICEPSQSLLKVALPVTLTALLAVISVLLALYYRYSMNIKIYLYSKNLCLWCVAEEELDKEKAYDIFISYSNKDESFVQNELLPELENSETPFRVCIHYRNWMPGEFISKQIINSVLDSRRTLVVLSNNFMESVWGKMEFRTAHMQAISEGRARVIVVIYGDLDENSLDEEMKAYLKTNTYVKWGDPWFWSKLKYALPHSKYKSRNIPSQSVESFHLR